MRIRTDTHVHVHEKCTKEILASGLFCVYIHMCMYIYSLQYSKGAVFESGATCEERWGAWVETQKNVRGVFWGWFRVPFNEPYAPLLSTIYDGA